MRKLFRAAFYRTENKKNDSNRISDCCIAFRIHDNARILAHFRIPALT